MYVIEVFNRMRLLVYIIYMYVIGMQYVCYIYVIYICYIYGILSFSRYFYEIIYPIYIGK